MGLAENAIRTGWDRLVKYPGLVTETGCPKSLYKSSALILCNGKVPNPTDFANKLL